MVLDTERSGPRRLAARPRRRIVPVAAAPPEACRTRVARRRAAVSSVDITRRQLVLGAVAGVLVLAGCGGGSDDTSGVTGLSDAMGTVAAPLRPERVVADSVSTMAHLWALGIVPVGAALPTGISPEYIDPKAGDVENLVAEDGWTLNVEETLAQQPDIVIATGAEYNTENCERYKAALTTFCFTEPDGTEESIKATMRQIATAVGREDEAEEAIEAYDTRHDELAQRIAATGLAGKKAGTVRFGTDGWMGIRVDGSQELLEGLGFRSPGWPASDTGYIELSMENLDKLNAADVLFVTHDDDADPEKIAAFDSPLWKRLKPVASGNAHIVSAWNGYDLPQLNRILDDVESEAVAPAESGGGTGTTG